jgi:hypothetical protein
MTNWIVYGAGTVSAMRQRTIGKELGPPGGSRKRQSPRFVRIAKPVVGIRSTEKDQSISHGVVDAARVASSSRWLRNKRPCAVDGGITYPCPCRCRAGSTPRDISSRAPLHHIALP